MSKSINNWLFLVFLFFPVGILAAALLEIPGIIRWFLPLSAGLAAAGALQLALQKNPGWPFWLAISAVPLGIFMGIWRAEISLGPTADRLKTMRDSGEIISLEGVVGREPEERSDKINYLLKTDDGDLILVGAPLLPSFNYGDRLKISGELLTPKEFPDFNYREFLKKDGVYSVIYYPEIELLKKTAGHSLYGGILKIKNRLRLGLRKILPYPQAELLGAVILGDKQLLPAELKESFNRTGLRHITAISGMHITIIAFGLMAFFAGGLRLAENRSFYLVLGFLALYIALVGAPPSAVRAGLMAGLVLLAGKVGRAYLATRALVLAAAAMLFLNPLLLPFDVGFQLSFLAVLGIIYLSPFFKCWLNRLTKNSRPHWLKEVLAMTLGAQISTLPILIYNFGLFSAVAPLTNVLVVPVLPLIIGFGFPAIVIGALFPAAGLAAVFPVYLLLTYVIFLSDFFAALPLSAVVVKNFHWSLTVSFYLFLAAAVIFLKKRFQSAIDKP